MLFLVSTIVLSTVSFVNTCIGVHKIGQPCTVHAPKVQSANSLKYIRVCSSLINPLHMTSHFLHVKGGRSLDNSCSLCMKHAMTSAYLQRFAFCKRKLLISYTIQNMPPMNARNFVCQLFFFACLYTLLTPKMTPRIGTCEYPARTARGQYTYVLLEEH